MSITRLLGQYHPFPRYEWSDKSTPILDFSCITLTCPLLRTIFPMLPKFIFNNFGFTLCGCLSWWRAIPSVIKFVQHVVDACGCSMNITNDCDCVCDDQVVLNKIVFKSDYKIVWDTPLPPIPTSVHELKWNESLTGICAATGHRVMVWNRHRAFRAPLNTTGCPANNWVAMPHVKNKTLMRDQWRETCG